MTRKEIIIKAWMDLNIETPFGICDKTGWVHGYFCNGIDDIINDYGDITDKIDYEIEYDGLGKFRPKSLRGIENNNGWIKIESAADLPKEDGFYWVIDSEASEVIDRYFEKGNHDFFKQFSSHYHPVIKPDLPLYQAVDANVKALQSVVVRLTQCFD